MAKSKNRKKPATEHERQGDPWFNAYRWPGSPRALSVVGDVLFDVEKRENRKRKRKQKDHQWLWQVGHVLVADLIYHYLSGSPGEGLVVPRAKHELIKKSRYRPSYITQKFPALLDTLQRLGYLQQTKGAFSGKPGQSRRTTIRPDARFIELIERHKVTFEDLEVRDAEEVIILKRAKSGYWDEGGPIEYDDTAFTKRLRAEVCALNAWLAKADITFDPRAHDRPVDVLARKLYRYFAADFGSGGRLFRGFWQNLPKLARLLGLRIQGEPVIELDYSQLNPMLAYAKVGCSPPPGDAYNIPGLEQCRKGVKKVFNALLFDRGPRESFPKGVNVLFPAKTKIGNVIEAIYAKHPKLDAVLSTGAGFHLMYRESEIMMRVLEELRYQAIVGLPIFDGVIVKASKAEAAKTVMKKEFKSATGMEIKVRLERQTTLVRLDTLSS